MVSIHQSDEDAEQNKTMFVVVWIYIFDSSDYSCKIVPAFGAWTRFSCLKVMEVISHIQPMTEFLERHCKIILYSVRL